MDRRSEEASFSATPADRAPFVPDRELVAMTYWSDQ
jgi:hypothetical protein